MNRSSLEHVVDGFVYGLDGQVVDYGLPNDEILYEVHCDAKDGFPCLTIERRECWSFYHVALFYVRAGCWQRGSTYHAASWNAVDEVWNLYLPQQVFTNEWYGPVSVGSGSMKKVMIFLTL